MSVDSPQDLVIVGMGVNDKDAFSITDDYASFDIKVEGQKDISIESDGFVTIVPLQEFLEFRKSDKLDYDSFNVSIGAVLLQNFSGEIRISVDNEGKIESNFDLNDYICHQFDEHVDVILDLPKGTIATEINEENLVSLLRDGKIDNILN